MAKLHIGKIKGNYDWDGAGAVTIGNGTFILMGKTKTAADIAYQLLGEMQRWFPDDWDKDVDKMNYDLNNFKEFMENIYRPYNGKQAVMTQKICHPD